MKIVFRNPSKNNIIIYDKEGSELISKAVLHDLDYSILHTRFEVLHVTLRVLLLMLKNIGRINWRYLKEARKKVRKFVQQVYKIYLFSLIEHISPDVVITLIDNCIYFQWLSRECQGAAFYAVQNGIRNKFSAVDLISLEAAHPLPGGIYSMPNLFCYGQNDADYYRRLGHKVDNFYPVGSLKGAYFKSELDGQGKRDKYDICLISEWTVIDMDFPSHMQKGLRILYDFLARFHAESNLSLSIATCSYDQREVDFFRDTFGNKGAIIKFDKPNFSSYYTVDNSTVLVTFFSSLAIEAFGWGKKILLCNFSGNRDYNAVRKDGIWALNEPDYEAFKDRLNRVYNMDMAEYIEMTREYVKYLMNYDFDYPAQTVIRDMILKELKNEV